jgi:lipocalin
MKHLSALLGLTLMVFGCAGMAESDPPLRVVDAVDLNRYLGKWYEIAAENSASCGQGMRTLKRTKLINKRPLCP